LSGSTRRLRCKTFGRSSCPASLSPTGGRARAACRFRVCEIGATVANEVGRCVRRSEEWRDATHRFAINSA
jgi:hypothetical protein